MPESGADGAVRAAPALRPARNRGVIVEDSCPTAIGAYVMARPLERRDKFAVAAGRINKCLCGPLQIQNGPKTGSTAWGSLYKWRCRLSTPKAEYRP